MRSDRPARPSAAPSSVRLRSPKAYTMNLTLTLPPQAAAPPCPICLRNLTWDGTEDEAGLCRRCAAHLAPPASPATPLRAPA
ncbi:hypothetical protein D5H75_31450 [Bailinhaonella thermotolerans]|uniref:Uncharacterized protein n=2 Tax=Bailinhaonella thermotolerans TaxID=1070861 RepID=A0A3A4ABT2_9ACTN|nr:hypothetical protein D5H75_31450 [Bailinhaonella thermotolerans]